MKNVKLISSAVLLILAACGVRNNSADNKDSLATENQETPTNNSFYAKIQMRDTIKAGDSVMLKFTVYNQADSVQHFCKWHTPFEPLMSKYLEIKNEKGEEVLYRGAMAKRIMPPPSDSYIAVNSKDSLSSTVDLLKGYDIKTPSTYTITYVGQNMSGLVVRDSISFVYKN